MTAQIIPFTPRQPTIGDYSAEPAVILILPVVERVKRDREYLEWFGLAHNNCCCTLGPITDGES